MRDKVRRREAPRLQLLQLLNYTMELTLCKSQARTIVAPRLTSTIHMIVKASAHADLLSFQKMSAVENLDINETASLIETQVRKEFIAGKKTEL